MMNEDEFSDTELLIGKLIAALTIAFLRILEVVLSTIFGILEWLA